MKRYETFRITFAVLLVFVLTFLPAATAVQAKDKRPNRHEHNATRLIIEKPTSLSIGQHSTIVIHLLTIGGYPIDNQTVELLVDGTRVRRARTNFAGTASVDFVPSQAETAVVTAIFNGSHKYSFRPSITSTKMSIEPAIVEVQTVPPVSGVSFKLGTQIFSSGADGIARVEVAKAGSYQVTVLPWAGQDPKIGVKFSRWGDDIFLPSHDIVVPTSQILQAGFDVSYQVSHTFVDLDNRPVDPSLITAYTLKGSDGRTYSFTDNLPHVLPSGRVVRLNDGLQETKILYSVMSVTMNGSNVVSQAGQRFFVHANDQWPIQLLLYTARFNARDALFPVQIGSGINLVFPDGKKQAFSFGLGGVTALLPRGLYYATVTNVRGVAPSTPIALSRSQDVNLLVVSDFDIIVVFALGIGVALGLLFMGRPRIFLDLAALRRRFAHAEESGD